jgi:large subunit ribosomal protein L25
MSEVFIVELRPDRGKRNAKRLRARGAVPAVLYGHGKDNISLSIPADQVAAVVRHGARVIDLQGAVSEKVLVSDLQWDTYGNRVLHLDLTRISEHETIEIRIPIELRGSAPGVKAGGVIEHLLHEVEITCPASRIPERLQVSINDLQLGGSIVVAAIPLPEGARLDADPDTVVVQCVQPREEAELEAVEAGGAEPEVIGRKAAEEEETEGG